MSNPKTISINAKCADLFYASLDNGKEYEGYVPDFFPGKHYGDYIEFEIDIETGQIVNWQKPTEEDLEIFQ